MAGDVRKSTARFARYRALRILWIRFGSVVALLLLGFILGRFSGVLDRPVEIALDSEDAKAFSPDDEVEVQQVADKLAEQLMAERR